MIMSTSHLWLLGKRTHLIFMCAMNTQAVRINKCTCILYICFL